MAEERKTKTDKLINKVKNNKWIAYVLLFSVIIIGIGQFTGAIKAIRDSIFINKSLSKKKQIATIQSIIKDLKQFLIEVESDSTHKNTLNLSVSSFSSQRNEYSAKFQELWSKTGLKEDEFKEVDRFYELEDYLFVTHKIPFLNKSNRSLLWFITDGLSSKENILVRAYVPNKINSDGHTKLDELSLKLYNQALLENPNLYYRDYVKTLLEKWDENYLKYEDLIIFMDKLDWNIAYMEMDNFLVQNSEYSDRFNKLNLIIKENLDLKQMGFSNPYDTKTYIEELIIILKRWVNNN
jgi:hypothetical protein